MTFLIPGVIINSSSWKINKELIDMDKNGAGVRIIYVRNGNIPNCFVDGVDSGFDIIITRSFYTARDIISDGVPTIVLADNGLYAGYDVSVFAPVLYKVDGANIIFAVVLRGDESTKNPQSFDCVVTMTGSDFWLGGGRFNILLGIDMLAMLIICARTKVAQHARSSLVDS